MDMKYIMGKAMMMIRDMEQVDILMKIYLKDNGKMERCMDLGE